MDANVELAPSASSSENESERTSADALHNRERRQGSSDALAIAAFICVAIGALVFYLIASRRLWFTDDDWDFLAGRRATSVNDLFRSHYGHWSTIPILAYRLLWSIVGLRSYAPYLFIVIALHVAIAALLLGVMRRAGVGSWTAAAAASLYLFFGTGAQDIFWGFQIGYKGALAFGLVHLLLADHDGPWTRRDWLGLAAGLIALMCSAVGVVMAGVVGLAMLMRRGWRIALLHAGPLLVAYVVWWSAIGHEGASRQDFAPGTVTHWVSHNIGGVFSALTKGSGLALVLGLVVVAGLVSAWRAPAGRHRSALPLALAAGGVAFIAIASLARSTAFGGGNPTSGRYEDIVAAMVLPLLAVGVDELRLRWRVLAVAAVALFLAGIPANVSAALDYAHAREPSAHATRRLVTTLAWDPMAREVPRSVKPLHEFPELFVTAGWLVDGARSGRIPKPGRITAAEQHNDTLRLSILQTSASKPLGPCHVVRAPETVTLQHGSSIGIAAWPLFISIDAPTGATARLNFNPGSGNLLTLVGDATQLRVASVSPILRGLICEP